jgi:hypothetical protein
VVLHQTGHLPEEQYVKMTEGYASFFDNLAEHLART